MTKKEKIIEKIKKNKVGLILCSLLIIALCLLYIVRLTNNNDNYNTDNQVKTELINRSRSINKANNMDYYTNPQYMISLNIGSSLTRNSNITNVPSGTWFAYFSIDPTDLSGIRWTNVYQSIYRLEYVIKNIVVDYVQYEYKGGTNYRWDIGTKNNSVITDIGFKTLTISSLTNEKRDVDNPEVVLETLEYYTLFTSSFLLNYNNYYLCDLSFSSSNDIMLYNAINSQFNEIYLNLSSSQNYDITGQFKIYDNRLQYKNLDTDNYESAYNSGYINGYLNGEENGYINGSQEGFNNGVDNVLSNPNNYDLYNQTQYDNNYSNGQNSVINNPNNYNLYNQTQYDNNYDNGKNVGYNEGFFDAESGIQQDGFKLMFNSILNAPYNILNGIFNFELFGVNLFNLFSFIITCGLILFVVKIFI